MRGRRIGIGAGALLFAACARFGVASEPPPASTMPSGSETPEAGTTTADSGDVDGGDLDGGDAGSAPFALDCSGTFVICENFDEKTSFTTDWQAENPGAGKGSLKVDGTRGHSGTNSEMAALSNGLNDDTEARIQQSPPSFGKGTLTAWVFTTASPTSEYNIIEISLNNDVYLDVRLGPSGLRLRVENSDGDNETPVPGSIPPLGTWVELTLTFDLKNNLLELTTSFDSKSFAQPAGKFQWKAGDPIELSFGLECDDGEPSDVPFDLWFDDIKVIATN